MIEKLTQPLTDVLKLGREALWLFNQAVAVRDSVAEMQMASIQHYGTKEAPLNGEPQSAAASSLVRPDYTNQLDFHQHQLTQDLPPSMQAYHRQKVAVLGELVIRRAA